MAEYRGATERGIPEWGLWIQVYETRKVLGIIVKRHEVPVPSELNMAIESSIRAAGAVPEQWTAAPAEPNCRIPDDCIDPKLYSVVHGQSRHEGAGTRPDALPAATVQLSVPVLATLGGIALSPVFV